jgi:hypothetical protein
VGGGGAIRRSSSVLGMPLTETSRLRPKLLLRALWAKDERLRIRFGQLAAEECSPITGPLIGLAAALFAAEPSTDAPHSVGAHQKSRSAMKVASALRRDAR